MDCKRAAILFEESTRMSVLQIERCGVGIANYVFIITTVAGKFVLRCSKTENAYRDTAALLRKLSACEIPVPEVLLEGTYRDYSFLILSYLCGDDLGNVYRSLSGSEKRQLAKEVAAIQRKVSRIDVLVDAEWTWNRFIDGMLDRAEQRIRKNRYFDVRKISVIQNLRPAVQEYLDQVRPIPYLDDISTKNLLIHEGRLSGIIDIDWIGLGDVLTFAALTRVALLNMELDTGYVDCLLDELRPDAAAYRAFLFYCLIFCVDFMGERGTRFLDRTVPVNGCIIRRLNGIFDRLTAEWNGLQ